MKTKSPPLSPELLFKMNAYWRAANYLSVGANLPLRQSAPDQAADDRAHQAAAPWTLGHDAGLNFIYVHLNRVIQRDDLNVIYIAGPGHGGPGLVANAYLEGTYSEVYPEITRTSAA